MEPINNNIINKPPVWLRWFILLIISFGMFGNYYVYDSISPLADLLKEKLSYTDSQIGLLNAIYSFPNIIMVLIGGMIIDRIGTRKSVLIFTFLVMLGALITALFGNIVTMAIGRLIFGLGAESMIVAITTVIAIWFKGRELSFAFGLNLTVARLGSFLALNSPTLAKSLFDSWQGPLLITVAAGVFAFICIVIYYFIDISAERKYSLNKGDSGESIDLMSIFNFSNNRHIIAISLVIAFLSLFIFIGIELIGIIAIGIAVGVLSYLNFKAFKVSFWLVVLLCVTFYSAMFPFQTFAIKYFQEAHGTTREVGGNLSSLLTLAAMIFTPLFGLLADKIGKRATLMMLGSLMIIPVYLLMAYKIDIAQHIGLTGGLEINLSFFGIEKTIIPYYLIIPMMIMGFSFSLIPAVMWPSVAIIVPGENLGTAYGLMTMIQNIGLFLFNIIIGFANDVSGANRVNPDGYLLGMWIFSTLGIIGFTVAFILRRLELSPNNNGLEIKKV